MTTTNKPRRMARPATAVAALPDKRPTKQSLVLDLMRTEGGVPLSAIMAATGWQAHTVRAALTGLRKQGHCIVRGKVEGETRYAVTAAVPA